MFKFLVGVLVGSLATYIGWFVLVAKVLQFVNFVKENLW